MYFETNGKHNTEKVAELALKVAEEKGIKHIVLASSTGYTARYFLGKVENLVVVPHVTGFKEPGVQRLPNDERQYLEENGAKICIATHVLSGAERSLSRTFGGISPVEVMAHTLRMFGQGTKVAVEVATMAIDAGLLPYGEDIIAIGGSGTGADTAVIMRAAHGANILETKIKEFICKPSEF